ncbi:MAG: hypothetical protein KDC92_03285 [Bacteroidetes bacterium]|nr:hypothetical protein [Bacteroidota bacterium]
MTSGSKIADLFDKKKGRKNRRKALLITVTTATSIVIIFAILGLKYQDPPPAERGSFLVVGPQTENELSATNASKGKEDAEEIEEPEEQQEPNESEPEQTDSEPEDNPTPDPEPDPTPDPIPTPEPDPKPKTTTPTEPKKPEQEPTKPKQDENKGDPDEDENDDFWNSKDRNKTTDPSGNNPTDDNKALEYNVETKFGKVSFGGGSGIKKAIIPDVNEPSTENAIVFIKVWVKPDGTVHNAEPDYSKNTTTIKKSMLDKAVNSAKNTKFEFDGDAKKTGYTIVSIKYEYKVK